MKDDDVTNASIANLRVLEAGLRGYIIGATLALVGSLVLLAVLAHFDCVREASGRCTSAARHERIAP